MNFQHTFLVQQLHKTRKYSPKSFDSRNVAKNHLATFSSHLQAGNRKIEQLINLAHRYEMCGCIYLRETFCVHKLYLHDRKTRNVASVNQNLLTNTASHHVANGNGSPDIGGFPIMSPAKIIEGDACPASPLFRRLCQLQCMAIRLSVTMYKSSSSVAVVMKVSAICLGLIRITCDHVTCCLAEC